MISNESDLMVGKICRSCMCENDNMHNIFEKNTDLDSTTLLSDMMVACASIQVASGDGLPNIVCSACKDKLYDAFEFRKQCQKSDSALRDLANIDNKKSTKNEESIVVHPDVHDDMFDDEDDVPLLKRNFKRKRGRPKKELNDNIACTFCHKILHTKKGLKVHLRSHTGEQLRYCLFCDAKYTRTNHLIRHISTHDKPDLMHPCESCSKTFQAAADLYRHSQEHQKKESEIKVETQYIKSEETVEPEITNQVTKDSDLPHIEILHEDKDDVFNEDFPMSDGYDNHDESDEDFAIELKDTKLMEMKKKKNRPENNDKALYECKECTKVMTTYIGLKIHMRKHTGAGLSTCKICKKAFTKHSHLVRHMRTHGAEEAEKMKSLRKLSDSRDKKVMECDYCDRKFKYKKSFVHHMQVEHGMSDVDSDFEGIKVSDKEKETEEDENVQQDEAFCTSTATSNPEEDTSQNTIPSEESPLLDILAVEEVESGIPDTENVFVKKSRGKNQICHVCGASFNRMNHLTRHMTLHRSILVHQCDRCDKAFSTEDHLKMHVEEEHINKPYVCTVCNKPFSRGEHLIRHLKVHQNCPEKEASLKCSICDSTFTRSDHLARHTKIHLLQDKRHVCGECGKAFNRLDNLKTHQRIHTGEKDTSKLHLCIYCGKEFNNSSNMIVHMRRHTGERPYKCSVCSKGFPRSHDLKCHERTHSGEKPYLCTLCGKSFNKSNKLLRHSRVHTGERPYVCNICGRAFTQSNDLALHMRRHTGARPYVCGVCPARFIQSGQLKTHRRTTGHWMDTQPDLKGGHRVEPVVPAHEPLPIRFKVHKALKTEEPTTSQAPSQQSITDGSMTMAEIQPIQNEPQRILMGIMGNIKLSSDQQPLLIDGSKLAELHNAGLVNLPSVIQTANGDEIKLKSEVGSFTIGHCDEDMEKQEENAASSFQEGVVIYSSVGHTSTTYTSSENFNFQNFH